VFGIDEDSLWESQQKWKNEKIRYLLGDIRNLRRVKRALSGVDYVFNMAAIKHVPFCEYNPIEAIEVNILGLNNIITASIEQKVKKLLHISIDKAVNPSNIMGVSKMVSERLLQIRWIQNPKIQMVCVRSGNVWNSRGSIVQIIKKLKDKNQPIPITDSNMTRFFIYPNELISLIINAFKEGKNGEIWVPKLKEVNLLDIVHNLVGKDYPIEIVGIRKGEKLHEELILDYEISISDESLENVWVIKNDYD